jgi:hypothetical protein
MRIGAHYTRRDYPMAYELGMQIIFDVVGKAIFIQFRGQSAYLEGPYLNRKEAVLAGEEYCRKRGWMDTPH